MAMQVETFEATELNEHLQPEDAAECATLATKLGLKGQARFNAEPLEDGTAQRAPYREMTEEERVVYGLLLPARETVENYARGPIPLRVLQVLEHARSLGIYSGFKVWHDQSGPDPILVGEIGYSTTHLLARWGESLEPFAQMRKHAVKKFKAAARLKLQKIARQVQADLEGLDHITDDLAADLEDPTYYGVVRS